jgi:hypothetical protein
LGAETAWAQERVKVRGAEGCDGCELRLERVASLGTIEDEELLAEDPAVLHDARGRYIAAGTLPATRILVYDHRGEFQEAWGRAGDGPGEFRDIRSVRRLPGDSVLVLEYGRGTVLDADGRYARSFTLPMRMLELEVLSDTLWVASGIATSGETVGRPLHVLTRQGVVRSSMGDAPVLVSRPSASQRVVGAAKSGVWAGRPDRYELEYWTVDGRLLGFLDREVDFFPDRAVEGAVSVQRERPSPWLRDIFVDSSGLVWTQIRVADMRWRPGVPYSYSHLDRHYDTIVEVIDPEDGELLGSERLTGFGHGFTNDGLIITHREGDSGAIVVDVFRATLTQPGRSQ